MALTAADVGDVDAGAQPVDEAGERDDHVEQGGVVDGGALLGHGVVEALVVVVGQPAAGAEPLDDLGDDLAHHRDQSGSSGSGCRRRLRSRTAGSPPSQ